MSSNSACIAEVCQTGMLLRHTLMLWIVSSTEHKMTVAEMDIQLSK